MPIMLESYKKLTNSIVGFVNNQRKLGKRTQNAIVPRSARAAFVEALGWAFAQNLTLDLFSEASCRLKNGKMLSTIEGTCFSRLNEETIGIFSLSGSKSIESKQPPRHLEWHQAIFRNSSYDAVLYCHPAAALAAARKRLLPDTDYLKDTKAFLGEAVIVEPDPQMIGESIESYPVLLVPGYGLITAGDDLSQAVTRAAIFARLCETLQ